MKRILLWGIGLLLVVLVTGGVYLSLYLDRHKWLFEDGIGAALGREVRIEKGVNLHWSMTPSIALRGLRLGNPDWAEGEYLARAERVVLRIGILALLRRRLDVKSVTVENADVALEVAADGRQNWSFGGESGRSPGLIVDAFRIENSGLSYRSPVGEVYRTDISAIVLDERDDGGVALDAKLYYRDTPIAASATFAARDISASGTRAFEGQVEIPGVTLRIDGRLSGVLEFSRLNVSLQNERMDLHETLSPLWPSMPVSGSLREVAGQFSTAGDTPRSLVSRLSGRLKIASADLARSATPDAEAARLGLRALSLEVTPEQPTRLQSNLVYQERSYDISLAGGRLEELLFEAEAPTTLAVEVSTQLENRPLRISGHLGPLSALHTGRNITAKLSLQQDELKVALDGTFASLTGLSGSQFTVDAFAPSLSRLNPVLGLAMPDTPPIAMTALVEGDERQLRFKKLRMTSGRSDIDGELSLPLVRGGRLEGSLTSNVLDLQRFLDHPGQSADQAQPILERELSVAALSNLAGTASLKVGLLHLDAIELEQVGVDAEFKDGHLELNVRAENERLTVDVALKPVGTEWQVALNHRGKMDLADLIARTRAGEDDSQAPLELDLNLTGKGSSAYELLRSAEGHLLMVLGEGRLSETVADYLPLGNVLYSLAHALLPEGKRKQQGKLECAVIQLDVAKGIATSSKGLALQTDEVNIVGGGALNLGTGDVELRFKTAKRKGIGLDILGFADRLVGVTGTLNNPSIQLNVGTTVAYGATAWATAGLSVLADSIYTRLTAFSNPCDAVLQATNQSRDGK